MPVKKTVKKKAPVKKPAAPVVTDEHKQAFLEIVTMLPKSKRPPVEAPIELLSSLLGIEGVDIMSLDKRGAHWKDSDARKKLSETWAKKREQDKRYEVTWRATQEQKMLSLTELAEITARSYKSVQVEVSRGGGRANFIDVIAHDVITVERFASTLTK